MGSLSVVLLHEKMVDKQGALVTTSLTLIDIHDIARSSRTFGVDALYVAHPAPTLRKLARTLQHHWEEGFGATYNPDRKEALSILDVASDLDEVLHKMTIKHGTAPKLIATSAAKGAGRTSFSKMREIIDGDKAPYLMMLGTGWGMSEELLCRANYFLDPIEGAGDFNHLSVRSACAILLDRLRNGIR